MNFIYSKKFTWLLCAIGSFIALISVFFLPDRIPVHFSGENPDGYGGKLSIFLFPAMQVLSIVFFDKVKNSKGFLSDIQRNLLTDVVLLLLIAVEVRIIYAAFA